MRCAGWLAGWLTGWLYLGRYSCLVVEHLLNLVMISLIIYKSAVFVDFCVGKGGERLCDGDWMILLT